MKKEDLYNSFNYIAPSDEQKSRMLNGILNQKKSFSTMKARRSQIILAAAIICCLMTTTVIATNIPAFVNLLEKISPDIAEYIEPVEEICIDQGIQMEVVAVGRYDNMVKVYVTLQDLTENRVGEDISFFDYYSIKGANSCGWSMIDYDKEKRKATILVEAENDSKFEGENLIFKIGNIFYDHKKYEDYETGIDLRKISGDSSYINASREQFMSWSGELSDEEIVPILQPHVKDIRFPEIKGVMISNIGIIDGKLHVQVWRDKTLADRNSALIYLKDSTGEELHYDMGIGFGIDDSSNPTSDADYPSYDEYIFDVDTDKLDEYELFGEFGTSRQVEGNWQVKFKAEDSGDKLEKTCDIDLGGSKIEKININPFGINLSGKVDRSVDLSDIDIKINTENDVIEASFSSGRWRNNNFFLLSQPEKPIDLDSVKSVTINERTVLIKE